jgi:hypothetical protein
MQAHRDQRQSNDLNLIWFGCIIYPSQWGGGKQFSCSNVVYLPLLRPEEGEGVGTKAVNREDKLSRRYRDRDLAKFERSRRYRER